jgi:hypothetical protein
LIIRRTSDDGDDDSAGATTGRERRATRESSQVASHLSCETATRTQAHHTSTPHPVPVNPAASTPLWHRAGLADGHLASHISSQSARASQPAGGGSASGLLCTALLRAPVRPGVAFERDADADATAPSPRRAHHSLPRSPIGHPQAKARAAGDADWHWHTSSPPRWPGARADA